MATSEVLESTEVHVLSVLGLSVRGAFTGAPRADGQSRDLADFVLTHGLKEQHKNDLTGQQKAERVQAFCDDWLACQGPDWDGRTTPGAELAAIEAIVTEVVDDQLARGVRRDNVAMKLTLHLLHNGSNPEHVAALAYLKGFLAGHLRQKMTENLGLAEGKLTVGIGPIDSSVPGLLDSVSPSGPRQTQSAATRTSATEFNLDGLANSRPGWRINQARQDLALKTLTFLNEHQQSHYAYVLTTPGATMAKVLIGDLATTVGVRIVSGPRPVDRSGGTGKVLPAGPQTTHLTASKSLIRARFARAIALQGKSGVTESMIEREDLGLYLAYQPDTGEYDLSEVGRHLLTVDLPEDATLVSACAGVLERSNKAGARIRARDLTFLVRLWADNLLWSGNSVPELVLHGSQHSAAVDRNLANLCEPLLENGTLTGEDVFTLACAAWLHDWGHAPGNEWLASPTSPNDVRTLHGLLSKARLTGENAYRNLHGLPHDIAERVALLSAHHQGWTSCDENPVPPGDPRRQLAESFNTQALAPKAFNAEHGALKARWRRGETVVGGPSEVGTIYEQAARSVGGYVDGEHAMDLSVNVRLLALLRLCDAADVGIHRAPDHGVLSGKMIDLWNQEQGIWLSTWGRDGKADKTQDLRDAIDTIFPDARSFLSNDLGAITPKEYIAGAKANIEKLPDEVVRRAMAELLGRLEIFGGSRQHYYKHQSVLFTTVALKPSTNGTFEIVPYVMPNHVRIRTGHAPTASTQALGSDAVAAVNEDVFREQGMIKHPRHAGKFMGEKREESQRKHAIKEYLDGMDLELVPAKEIPNPRLHPSPSTDAAVCEDSGT